MLLPHRNVLRSHRACERRSLCRRSQHCAGAARDTLTYLPSPPETPVPGLRGGLVGGEPMNTPTTCVPQPPAVRTVARVSRAGADVPLELIRNTLADVS